MVEGSTSSEGKGETGWVGGSDEEGGGKMRVVEES